MLYGDISQGMRDVLISHIDGRRVPFLVTGTTWQQREQIVSTAALMRRQLLKPWRGDQNYSELARPKFTVITDIGREALGKLLGDYADAILKARALLAAGAAAKRIKGFGPNPEKFDLSLHL